MSTFNDYVVVVCFFFFQAEDGIRDADVTGVQTCALPIWPWVSGVVPPTESLSSRRRAAHPRPDGRIQGREDGAAPRPQHSPPPRPHQRRTRDRKSVV